MDPAEWRVKAGLTLKDMAEKSGKGISTVRRYEIGEKDAPNTVVLAYERASGSEVTGADFQRVRKRWERAHARGDTTTTKAA